MKAKDEKWAVFWCGLLHPVLFGEVEASQTNQFLKDLAQKEVLFPDGRMRKPSLSTLRRYHFSSASRTFLARSRDEKGF